MTARPIGVRRDRRPRGPEAGDEGSHRARGDIEGGGDLAISGASKGQGDDVSFSGHLISKTGNGRLMPPARAFIPWPYVSTLPPREG